MMMKYPPTCYATPPQVGHRSGYTVGKGPNNVRVVKDQSQNNVSK